MPIDPIYGIPALNWMLLGGVQDENQAHLQADVRAMSVNPPGEMEMMEVGD